MKKSIFYPISFLYIIVFLSFPGVYAQNIISEAAELLSHLDSLENLNVASIRIDLKVKQPLDHDNPEAGYFEQRIFLRHKDRNKPVVFETEGYAARPAVEHELTKLLDANQIHVEHRFFGQSIPDSLDYTYLNIRQAAADHHRIVKLFRSVYTGKWVATGISKGGQTAMYLKRFYPDAVDATVCYVAPLNFSDADPRVYKFLDTVGPKECRDRIFELQKHMLEHRAEFLPFFEKHADKKKYTFKMGIEKAYEYWLLEYPFSFWQWQSADCADIPDTDAEVYDIFDHVITASNPYYFSDTGIDYYRPFFHQALNEIGYYGFEIEKFDGLLVEVNNEKFTDFGPVGVMPEFNPAVMHDIADWLNQYGNNMIYIYGEYDPWSAPAVQLSGATNALVVFKAEGSHATRIRHLSDEDREKVYERLEQWLQVDLSD